MFKNAEYRLSLASSLGIGSNDLAATTRQFALKGVDVDEVEDIYNPDKTSISGKVKVKYARLPSLGTTKMPRDEDDEDVASDSMSQSYEVEVDVNAYLSELQGEVKLLRDELEARREAREEELRKDLLAYIRTLPEQQLRDLTSTVSPDVLAAMKGLVRLVMQGIGEGKIGADTVTEQSGEAMAQLCMWQLVVGYNLRELEVREEMKEYMLQGKKADIDGGIILDNE